MFPIAADRVDTVEETSVMAAMAVLQHRLAGLAHESAVARVAASHGLSAHDTDLAWTKHKRDALTELTIGRVIDACPWTEAEIERLMEIYAGESWWASSAAGAPMSAARPPEGARPLRHGGGGDGRVADKPGGGSDTRRGRAT